MENNGFYIGRTFCNLIEIVRNIYKKKTHTLWENIQYRSKRIRFHQKFQSSMTVFFDHFNLIVNIIYQGWHCFRY